MEQTGMARTPSEPLGRRLGIQWYVYMLRGLSYICSLGSFQGLAYARQDSTTELHPEPRTKMSQQLISPTDVL